MRNSLSIFALSLLWFFLFLPQLLWHHDIGWHLAAGDLIRSLGHVPATDPWSFASGGVPWVNHAWFYDVAASWLFAAGGFTAWIVVTLILAAMIPALVPAGIIVALLLPLGFEFRLSPLIPALLLFALFLRVLQGRKLCYLAALPALMVVWVNIHASFLLAFVLLGAFGLQAVLAKDWQRAAALAAAAIACVVTAALNPWGVHIFGYTFEILSGVTKGAISEWQVFDPLKNILRTAYVLAFVWVVVRGWRAELPLAIKILSLFFFVLALMQQRHFMYFVIVSAPWVVSAFSVQYRLPNFALAALAGLGLATLHPSIIAWRFGGAPDFPSGLYPREEITYLMKHHRGARVYNHWDLGSYLIYAARGELKVLVDGRAETAYPKEHLASYLQPGTEQTMIDNYRLKVAILPKAFPERMEFFDKNRQWKRAFEGDVAVVYVATQHR